MSELSDPKLFTEDKYTLIGQTPVPCTDLLEWARWMGDADRRVAETAVGDWRVSTVFLGLDHNYARILGECEEGSPILFETMIFYGPVSRLEYADMSLEGLKRTSEERQALIDKLPPKEQGVIDRQERYATWPEAEAGHETAVRLTEETTGIQRNQPTA